MADDMTSTPEPVLLPPNLPCYLAFAIPPDAEAPPRPGKVKSAFYLFFFFASVASAIFAAFLLLVALGQGHFRLPLMLVFAHLPLVAAVVQWRRQMRRHRGRFKQWLEDFKLQSLLGSLLNLSVSPFRCFVRDDGLMINTILLDQQKLIDWNNFVAFEFTGEAEGCFAVRLQYKNPLGLAAEYLSQRAIQKSAGAKPEQDRKRFSLLTTLVASLWLAVDGLRDHGWRADVQAAFCLVATWIFALCIPLIAILLSRLKPAPRAARTDETEVAPKYQYLVFDSREVTAQAVLERLTEYLG